VPADGEIVPERSIIVADHGETVPERGVIETDRRIIETDRGKIFAERGVTDSERRDIHKLFAGIIESREEVRWLAERSAAIPLRYPGHSGSFSPSLLPSPLSWVPDSFFMHLGPPGSQAIQHQRGIPDGARVVP
jgi:hypothetical protein